MGTGALPVAAGVDTHKDVHVLCVIDALGRKVREGAFPATPNGYRDLADAIGGPGGCLVVGVEGTCSFGAGLAAHPVCLIRFSLHEWAKLFSPMSVQLFT